MLGLLVRVVIGVAIAVGLAGLLALVREGGTFIESLRVTSLLVGCLLLLMAVGGQSPTMRGGAIDPLLASFFRGSTKGMTDEYSGTQVSPAALFVLSALALFGLGFALG